MNTMSKIINNGTDYYFRDSQARADILECSSDIKQLLKTQVITKDDLENGTWSYSNKSGSSSRLRNAELIPIFNGMRVSVVNPTQRVYIGILETTSSTSYLEATGWTEVGENMIFNVTLDGYLVLIIEGQSGITIDDYDCEIKIQNKLAIKQDDDRSITRISNTSLCEKWNHGTVIGDNGRFSSGNGTYIRPNVIVGYPDGITKITCDSDYRMYIAAFDKDGLYVGLYKNNNVFNNDPDTSTYKKLTSIDCTQYPDYRMLVLLRRQTSSTRIEVSEGVHAHFHTTDETLTEKCFAADSKAVGDAISTINTRINEVAQDVSDNEDSINSLSSQLVVQQNNIDALAQQLVEHRTIQTISSSDLEQGTWAYSSKSNNSSRIRNKELYPVQTGMYITYSNPTKRIYFGILETTSSTSYCATTGWIEAGGNNLTYQITNNGYLVIIIEGSSGITVADYDCDINIVYDILAVHTTPIMHAKDIEENDDKLFMIFQKVGVIGDSLSVGFIQAYHDEIGGSRCLPYSWVKQIGRDSGVPWLNFGQSGFTTLTWCSDQTYGKVQMEAQGNKCQAYIIGLGVNDEWETYRHVDLGTTADIIDDPDVVATTFYGGYNRIIQLLKRRNPTCKIFCLTSPIMVSETPGVSYNEAVRYIATQHYTTEDNVFLTDLYPYREYFVSSDYTIAPDKVGVHFSPVGYRSIANVIEKALNKVIHDNLLCFQNTANIPFDTGTPTANTMTE